jgi:hypothetical protein
MKRKTTWKFLIILLILGLLGININLPGITVAQVTHDVAVVEVTPYPTKVGLGLNESVDITVVVANKGTENENFTVTVSYDSTVIETQNVTDLTPTTNRTLNFAWDTSNVTVGTYSINATAIFVPDTNTADNTLISDSKVYVVSPYITILPRTTVDTTLTPGKNYTISIYTNYNGSDIWGYQFMLTYNTRVLEGVEVVNGDLIKGGDVTFIAGDFNNAQGKLGLTAGFFTISVGEPLNKTSGPGILANVTFTIVGEGDSPIELVTGSSGTELKRGGSIDNIIDYFTDLNTDPAKGKILSGLFQNVEEVIHDMAVISLDFSPNNVIAGELVTINVTIKNKGNIIEEVNVTVYWDFGVGAPSHPIGDPETVTIGSGENKTIGFTWDTTEVTGGPHPLIAEVNLLGGLTDVNPLDNMLKIDDAVTVRIFQGTPLPIDLIIIVVVVIAALVVIYIVIRRIRK